MGEGGRKSDSSFVSRRRAESSSENWRGLAAQREVGAGGGRGGGGANSNAVFPVKSAQRRGSRGEWRAEGGGGLWCLSSA